MKSRICRPQTVLWRNSLPVAVLFFLFAFTVASRAAWQRAQGPLNTPWTQEVSPNNVLPEYPRPSLVREAWLNLNGLWDYAIVARDAPQPTQWDGQILVPFAVESALSGVMKRVGSEEKLWYRRTLKLPAHWNFKSQVSNMQSAQRLLLHFGAVDWEATVWVNGQKLGAHRGGYDRFSFDITDALKPAADQEIVVAVWDPTDTGYQARGKQVLKPGGIMYTPTTGIWQTPWLEPLAVAHIQSLKITPDLDQSAVTIKANATGVAGKTTLRFEVLDEKRIVQTAEVTLDSAQAGPLAPQVKIKVPNAKAWSPDSPFLYDLLVTVRANGQEVDRVKSYFGLRKISLGKDENGFVRLQLNNQPLFQLGPLDQGFWPDGLYTAPTDDALRYDVEMTKGLGMNMARKHVKVEPERWYYWCDKLGLLVWQDMPSGNFGAKDDTRRSDEAAVQYELELKRLIEGFYNHPSIVIWVPFNEGWGQHETPRYAELVKQWDPTRLVNEASGWTDRGSGDVKDIHAYPGPAAPKPEDQRATVLGEFGGLGLPVRGHTWQEEENWGYRSYKDSESLTLAYVQLMKKLHPLIGSQGLSAAVYTQTSDVEVEVNGLMTYDRALVKMDAAAITKANRSCYLPPPPPPIIETLMPTSQEKGLPWNYTLAKPADGWFQPGFDASSWKTGLGGFGTRGTPGVVARTEWSTSNIWLRREFELPANFKTDSLQFIIHHDEDAVIYLNGIEVASFTDYTSNYELMPATSKLKQALKPGKNLIAIHCQQTGGGQYIDAGLANVIEREPQTAAPAKQGSADLVVTVMPLVQPLERGGHYVFNRAPLAPSPFLKLPIGAITPKGWARHMLELERDGMIGRLKEISRWLDFKKSAWTDREGKGGFGWEEMPYWLKGYGDLGYVLRDQTLIAETKSWIEAALASRRDDGFFGPRELLTSLNGKPDLWPHMVMLNILQSYHEFSGDPRVLELMTRYFKWEDTLPASAFGEGYWPKIRAGDNIESIYWLYNRLGEGDHSWLFGLATKIHQNMAAWHEDVINWHNVNIAQGFRAGTVYWMQGQDPTLLYSAERNYQKVMGTYGQFPGGGFVGDENSRPGYVDPRGGIETCGIVEFMHSFEMLTKITGNPIWSDRNEEITFNTFPASMTPDQKGLHYITCANQVQLDRHNKSPGIQNGGTMFSYSPFAVYRCCQHNVSHGWPYYAEELWLATHDQGLCASLYAESEVAAKVGDGTTVKIIEETGYPFSDTITLKVIAPKAVTFPLYLRIPGWCHQASVKINGQSVKAETRPQSYLVLNRAWKDGDLVTLRLPMEVAVRKWVKNQDSVSVEYGPLTFSLAIQEKWERYGNNEDWPEWEVFPASDWNYGLALETGNPAKSFKVEQAKGPVAAQPWTADTTPIKIQAKARRIPGWQTDRLNMVGKLQPSPAKTDEPLETVTLIPLGAARLRIASFPTVTTGPDGHEWVAPPKPRPSQYKASASHCFGSDTLDALGDGLEPANSNDHNIPRFTWWPRQGSQEWAQFDFKAPRKVSQISVYWFDDTGVGQCRAPQSWTLLYRAGGEWRPVEAESHFGTSRDGWNTVKFKPVETTALRIQAQLKPEFSSGILEWKVGE